MVKRRKYGDAWKDVRIDAEQNDAVFDRFFKRTPVPDEEPAEAEPAPAAQAEGLLREATTREPIPEVAPPTRGQKRPQPRAVLGKIEKATRPDADADITSQVDKLKQQYRLSKGEAAILKQLMQRARGEEAQECYAKVPELADACSMTHRGCQFALKNLQARGFILRVKNYDPADRLGIKFQITVPSV
ncbi:MAG TPA: hypothetical protein VF591_18310 [Pyrinomonadaceae bacterium]|jgi:DNA-binding MarR family transcriptional regulator